MRQKFITFANEGRLLDDDDGICCSFTFDVNAGISFKIPHSGNCAVEQISMFADALFNIFPICRSLISFMTFSRFFSCFSRNWRFLRRINNSSVNVNGELLMDY